MKPRASCAPGGRLLIADFAPHELEFLRSDYAHRRLGFSDKEVQGWFSAAGLKPLSSDAVTGGKDKLIVKIWLAQSSAKSRAGGRMSIQDLVTNGQPPIVSFEFSPPKTSEAEEALWKAIKRLEPLAPSFVSVTYGAGGSTRDRTHATVKRIVDETKLKPAAHLTCVGHPKSEIDAIARAYWDSGIRHIVALRGDMPDMQGAYRAHDDGYRSTPE